MYQITDKTPKVYLSRKNLQTLLSKLDRLAAGDESVCSILKVQHSSPAYRQTMPKILIVAVEDADYYCAQQRPAGTMHPDDEENLGPHPAGLASDALGL